MSHTINGEDLRLLWHEIEYGYRSNKEIARKTTCPTLKDAHKICTSVYSIRRYEVKYYSPLVQILAIMITVQIPILGMDVELGFIFPNKQ